MKHRAISILLALTFLLSVFMFCTTAFAAAGEQGGVTAELTTDKTAYVTGESVSVKLVVKNSSYYVNNVRTELVLPAGLSLSTGALTSQGVNLAPGGEVKYDFALTVDVPTTSTTQAPTTQAPTTQAPTTQAPTTQAPTTSGEGGGGGSANTGDITTILYGTFAVASLIGMVALFGFKSIMKQRWFILVLCGALVLGVAGPVVASAVATEKSFTVVENITVDGEAAEVKAVISYDLNDEVVHTEEVAFKKDGAFLWNYDLEQGYYLGSDISWNGQTTSKDGSYRPEVNAPYIDMLYGCTSILNNQYYPGELSLDIFNTDAEQTALIGLTDDPASLAALELIGTDEWIIHVIDGKLVVTGWYDNATVAAARALHALATVDAADINLSLPMIGKMDYVSEAPEFTAGQFQGGMDSDFGAVVLRYNEIVEDDFDAYCAQLVAAGYELYETNTMDGFKAQTTLRFATYVKGDDAVLVQYLPVSFKDVDVSTLTSAEKKAVEAACYMEGDTIRVILTSVDRLGNNEAANAGWTDAGISPKLHLVNGYDKYSDGNSIGQCQIFTLADGSFIVVDGGSNADAENVYRTLKYMNEREDGKIVVAAWILTHAHSDHTGALGALASSEWASEITVEQIVLNHVAVSYRYRSTGKLSYRWENAFSAEFANIQTIIPKFAQGENYKLVMPHMGQVMHIRNAEVEFLTVGDEDMAPVLFTNDNAQSLVFRVTFPETADQEIMILGDSALDQTYNVFFPLMTGELHAEILQVAHHGLGGQTSRFYPMFPNVEVAIWPTDSKTITKNGLMTTSTNKALQDFDPLNIVCEEYVQTLNIPFDKETDQVIKTKLSTFKTKFQDAEVTLASLGVGRFANDVNRYLEATVNYLLGENVDADVLVLNSVRYLQADGVNVVEALAKAMDYSYYYYAPAWNQVEGADLTASNDGTYGNLILSRYPILSAENLVYHEGTTADSSNEGRSAGHVVLDVEGKKVDVYFTEVTGAGNWTEIAEVFEPANDVWFVLGVGKNTVEGIQTALGDTTVHAAVADHTRENIYANGKVTFAASSKQSVNDAIGCANMDALITATANVSLYTAPEASTAPVRDAFVNWWVNSWGRDYGTFTKVVKTLKEVHPSVAAFHMVNQDLIGMTEEQVKAELGYPYAIWVPNNPNGSNQWSGHWLVSEYPIEDLGTLTVSDGSDDPYNQPRIFGHAVVTINDTAIDVWYGSVGPNIASQNARLEAAVNAVAVETGRPFIISTNDANWKDLTSFAGYQVQNYWTSYETNVLISKGAVSITGTETKDAGAGWAGVDVMNIIDITVADGALVPGDPYQPPVTPDPDPEPEVPEGTPVTLKTLEWWCNFGGGTTAGQVEEVVAFMQNGNFDVAVLTHWSPKYFTDESVFESFTNELGFDHYAYVTEYNAAGDTVTAYHVLLSKYPISDAEQVSGFTASDATRAFGKAVIDVEGLNVDVFWGFFGGTATDQQRAQVESDIAAARTSDTFIFLGGQFKAYEEYAGAEVSQVATGNSIVASAGITVANGKTIAKTEVGPVTDARASIDPPVYADLTVYIPEEEVEPTTLNVAAWWVSWKSNFNSGSNRANTLAMMAAQDIDVLVLSNINLNDGTGTAAGEAEAFGFAYYDFVPFTSADPTLGTILMSKYPFTFVEEFAAGTNSFKLVQFVIDGTTVDFYFGGDPDYDALGAKVAARQAETKNPFIVALKGAPQTLATKLEGLTDADGNPVTTFAAFWGTSNGVLVSSPMTADEIAINPTSNGFPSTAGMGDRAIMAPVVFPVAAE